MTAGIRSGGGGGRRTRTAHLPRPCAGGTPNRWDDRGASATEYMGAVIVVVAIVTALLATQVGQAIADKFRTEVCKVLGGNCGSGGPVDGTPLTDADFEPPLCQVSSISDKAGDKIKILFFEMGNEFGVQEQHFKSKTDINHDGKVDDHDELVYLTFTDAASVGLQKDFTPGMKVGNMGDSKIELSGSIKVTNGDTYVFESPEEAAKFRKDIETIESFEMQQKMPGGGEASLGYAVMDLLGTGPLHDYEEASDRVEDALGGNRRITYGKVGLDLAAAGGLEFSPADEEELSAKLGGHFKFSPEATWTDDKYHNTKSYTYSAAIQYGADASVSAGPVTGGASTDTTRTGTVTVTKDKDTGELLSINMTQTIEQGGSKGKISIGGDNGAEGKDKRGGKGTAGGNDSETGIQVVTNSITFPKGSKGDADRAIAQQWLDGSGDRAAPFSYMFGDHAPTQRPGNDDPFGQLLFDKGKSSKTRYTGETNAAEYGFELNLGLSLGFSVSTEHKEETLNDAQFLGAPHDARRSYLPYSYCAN